MYMGILYTYIVLSEWKQGKYLFQSKLKMFHVALSYSSNQPCCVLVYFLLWNNVDASGWTYVLVCNEKVSDITDLCY